MRKTAHVQRRFDTEHRILDKLSEILPVGEPTPGMSYPAVAERIGEAAHAVLLAKNTMEDAGILRVTLDYPKGQSGRVSIWELLLPVDVAHEEMRREHERQLARPSRKAARKRNLHQEGEPAALAEIQVPRLEQSQALVREARSYLNRIEWAREHIRQMREQGIDIDPDAVTVRRDERLEHIVEVLPAIDQLEQENERLTDQVARWLGNDRGKAGIGIAAF